MADVKDISFKNERLGYKFNYRVAALIFNKDKVLLQKAEDNDSYFLLGGRVQFGEDTTEAIKREVYEETGVTIDDNSYKLLDIVENFFVFRKRKVHELLFIYRINDIKELNNKNNFKTLDKDDIFNIWVKIDKIDSIDVLPNIVKTIINKKSLRHDIVK